MSVTIFIVQHFMHILYVHSVHLCMRLCTVSKLSNLYLCIVDPKHLDIISTITLEWCCMWGGVGKIQFCNQ